MTDLNKIPVQPHPVYIIGAGGIVNTAHLPAYAIAGFDVQGIFDLDTTRAKQAADKFAIPQVFQTLPAMISAAPANAIFDIAVPATDIINILLQLPDRAIVLMQKPMGIDLAAAKEILQLTRRKKMLAAVNFQLRYAPFVLEAKQMIAAGLLGEINDIEINVNVYTPWQLWDFLFVSPRVEIPYHSIHYIDLVRNLLGNPQSVYAKTTKHPGMKALASVRSSIIMDYGEMIRANILTNHCHIYGMEKQQAYIKIEGSLGAVKMSMGILKNYPSGEPDQFEYIINEPDQKGEWKVKELAGSWFPHAFIGSMQQVMLAAEEVNERADNSVEDAIHTMACVEAAYRSSEMGGVRPEI